ncbi:FIG00387961: hypothetical protein [hydrothermal vent metagenome]|uniref:AB hydrolase-1 domain-containing protein n=1 Tax=hydrothermal vent metagenome TaxID=652676 RepID=A0A1W1EHP0_9ZZZZ
MKYFSGFLLNNEQEIFNEYLIHNDMSVAGFSYGAIKAFEYVYNSKQRVDRLILLSPSFFQDKPKSYARRQLKFFNHTTYVKSFLENISYPSNQDMSRYYKADGIESLEELLRYNWDKSKLKELQKRGVEIEVFLGSEDRIIDSRKAFEFFEDVATIYFIKGVGHILN